MILLQGSNEVCMWKNLETISIIWPKILLRTSWLLLFMQWRPEAGHSVLQVAHFADFPLHGNLDYVNMLAQWKTLVYPVVVWW